MLSFAVFAVLAAAPSAAPTPAVTHSHIEVSAKLGSHRRSAARPLAQPSSSDLFSLRARRRFAAYLRMRLLEMREAGLARAADAVERSLPIDEILAPPR